MSYTTSVLLTPARKGLNSMSFALRTLHLLLLVLVLIPATAGCGDMINPQRQKELGVVSNLKDRYGTASGIKALLGEPKFPGLHKGSSVNMEVLDNSDPTKVKDAIGTVVSWYAEANAKGGTGEIKLWVYGLKDGKPIYVGSYEAGALDGKEIKVEEATPANLPAPGEKT